MKRILSQIGILCLTASLMAMACSCNKDKDGNLKNQFRFDGETCKIFEAEAAYYGYDSDYGYNVTLSFCSEDEEKCIWFDLYTARNNNASLQGGTYGFHDRNFLLSEAGVYMDYSGERGDEITSGTLTVKNSGSNYTVEMNGKTYTGKSVKLHYSGHIDNYIDDYKKKDKRTSVR